MKVDGIKSLVIIDASALLTLLLPDEVRPRMLQSVFVAFQKRKINFISPIILQFEIANGLRSAVARSRITELKAQKLLEQFLKLPIHYQGIDFQQALIVAVKHELSFYDAAYVQLAQQKKTKLLTLDTRLAKLAK